MAEHVDGVGTARNRHLVLIDQHHVIRRVGKLVERMHMDDEAALRLLAFGFRQHVLERVERLRTGGGILLARWSLAIWFIAPGFIWMRTIDCCNRARASSSRFC